MALLRAASLCRLALRTQWAPVRLLSTVAVAEPPGDDGGPERRFDTDAPRWQRSQRPEAERRLFVPPPLKHRLPKSMDAERRLHRHLMDVSATVDEVLGHATAHLALLDQFGVLTALWAIVKLVAKGDQPAHWLVKDERFLQVLNASRLLMLRRGEMDALGYSFILRALGQLGVKPPLNWRNDFWHRSALLMGEYSPEALCNMLCACGQIVMYPTNRWWQRFWSALISKMTRFTPHQMCSVWRACEQLDCRPHYVWSDRFWRFTISQLGKLRPQHFSEVLHACGKLQVTPPDEWLHHFWIASGQQLGDFTPQQLNDTLIACGELGIAPPGYWMQRFWHASALQLADFTPLCLSQTMFTCGLLGITPPADWLARYWYASGSKLAQLDPLRLSKPLYACAHLDVRPPADWLQSLSDSFERSLKDADRQALSDTAMALAMFRGWELPLWPGLWEHLSRSFSHDYWLLASFQTHARQMYRTYQAAAVERPGLLPAPNEELLTRALDSCIKLAQLPRDEDSIKLCDDVSACLTRMGVAHANEWWCERAERSIDIAIKSARAPVAVQVDGSHHYLQDGRPTGSTRLRNRMLAAHGWRVAVVDYRLWRYELQTEAQREDYLRRLIA